MPARKGSGGRRPARSQHSGGEHEALAIYLRDVSRLHPPTPEEERALARQTRLGDANSRKKLIALNLRLVVDIAKRYAGFGLPLPDLIEEGNVGLIRAVGHFDERKGFKLSTYATWWIRQAVTRALVNQARLVRLPSHVHSEVMKVLHATRALAQDLGREPDVEEIAKRTRIPIRRVEELLDVSQRPVSFEAPVQEDDRNLTETVPDKNAAAADDELMSEESREKVMAALKLLEARERKILELRFGFRNNRPVTLDQAGKIFGVTRERVRQIERRALARVRTILTGRHHLTENELIRD